MKCANNYTRQQFLVFSYGLPLLLLWIAWKIAPSHLMNGVSLTLGVMAVVMICCRWCVEKFWWKVFEGWMCIAQWLGKIVTVLVLAVCYYGLITPIAWVLRRCGKCPLESQQQGNVTSYWNKRIVLPYNDYKKQF